MNRILLILIPLLMCGAASFNGTTDGASTGSALNTIGTNILTFSYYIRHNATNVQINFELAANPVAAGSVPSFSSAIGNVSGYEDWGIFGGTSGSSWHVKRRSTFAKTGSWGHRVVVLDRQSSSTNQIRCYFNGVAETLVQVSTWGNGGGTTAFNSGQSVFFGARNNSASLELNGYVQEFAIFAGEVSAAEAYMLGAQRMSPLKVRSAKLINYWPFSAGENASNSPDLVGGIPVNSGTKSIVLEQAPAYRK